MKSEGPSLPAVRFIVWLGSSLGESRNLRQLDRRIQEPLRIAVTLKRRFLLMSRFARGQLTFILSCKSLMAIAMRRLDALATG